MVIIHFLEPGYDRELDPHREERTLPAAETTHYVNGDLHARSLVVSLQ